jgi:Flp pilus assembly protein TadG
MRSHRGFSLAETGMTFACVVPLLFLVIFIAIEACQAFSIWQALSQGARESARRLATTYAVDPGIVGNTSDQSKYGFDPVRIQSAIADSSQFNASFNTAGSPGSVTVTTNYAPGQFGLAPFPQVDPLHLGSSFKLTASATYNLE